jgi:hypothetical protein
LLRCCPVPCHFASWYLALVCIIDRSLRDGQVERPGHPPILAARDPAVPSHAVLKADEVPSFLAKMVLCQEWD